MLNRRNFLRMSGTLGFALGNSPLVHAAKWYDQHEKGRLVQLTVLHTNDVHSRIDPFPMDGGKNQGRGGAAKRADLINRIRSQEEHVLLLDCGDMFQGTPYFNFFKGELEVRLMSKMGYDAATIGNHDFDGGIDNLYDQIKDHAQFSLLNANYQLADTPLHQLVKPYKVFVKGGVKVGVFGLGVELDGLVPRSLIGDTRYLDPIKQANQTASFLKKELQCQLVICLSHLGFHYKNDKVCDIALADQSADIDLILGGHTHTFMERPYLQMNVKGKPVLVSQVGWAGMILGRIDVIFDKKKKDFCFNCKNMPVYKVG